MRPDVLEQLHRRLLEKKVELLKAIRKSMGNSQQPEVRMGFDLVKDNPDRSVDELLKHISAHVLGSRGDELELIESALLKIREGTYGVCEMCGGRIAHKRLLLYPEAVYCVACQGRLENMRTLAGAESRRPQPPGPEAYLEDDE